jgi:membrane fusion protein, macrolide-specific efflux system
MNLSMKKKWIVLGVALVSFLAVAIWFRFKDQGLSRVALGSGAIVEAIYGLGTVTSDKEFHPKAGVSLSLTRLPVKEGQRVREGELLAQLDQVSFRAPFSGTITQVFFHQGEPIPPQATILTLTSLEELSLEVSLEQQSVLRVREGQTAALTFDTARGQRWDGIVKSIFPRDSQFIVRIQPAQWPEGVLPGMTADVAIEIGKKENALLLPLLALKGGKVERFRDGSRAVVEPKLGAIDGERAEVLSGDLKPGDLVTFTRSR